MGHPDHVSEPVQALASYSTSTQLTLLNTAMGHPAVSVPSTSATPSVSSRPEAVQPSCLDVVRQALRNQLFTEPVVEMASAPIRDSSCHLYNTHWKLFTDWLISKEVPTHL